MKSCTFFGHHDCPDSIKPVLFRTIKNLIDRGIIDFYVGNQGNFDVMVLSCLREIKKEYQKINYYVVLAYLPQKYDDMYKNNETIFPEGIELKYKRFAIDYRNRWMLEHADTVIAYVKHSWGGAVKYVKYAENKSKTIVYIED